MSLKITVVFASLVLGLPGLAAAADAAAPAEKPSDKPVGNFVSLKVEGCNDQCAEFEIRLFDNGRLLWILRGTGRENARTAVARWEADWTTETNGLTFDAPRAIQSWGIDWRWIALPDNSGIVAYRVNAIALPLWMPIVLTLVLGYLLEWRRWLGEHRIRAGLCPVCAYDVRATPDRCPECGAIPRETEQKQQAVA
jgi:hypothetical protein